MRLAVSFVLKLLVRSIASLCVVFLAFWIAAYLPFVDEGGLTLQMQAGAQESIIRPSTEMQTFATSKTPALSGFIQADSGPGFSLEEVTASAPCLGAGQRYLDSLCPDCDVKEVSGFGESRAVLFWVEGDTAAPTARAVFRDCSEQISSTEVLVPTLTVGADQWLSTESAEHMPAQEILPLSLVASPLSVLTLGSWEIAEYDISHEVDVAGRITDWLLARNWTLPGEQIISDSAEQLVYVSEGEGMLVLTFNEGAAGKTLIAMHNKAGEQS